MYNLKLTQLAHLRLLDTNSNCSNTALQKDYQGTRATTRGGLTCQPLSEQSPHKHISTQSERLEWVATQPNLCFFWPFLTVCCDEVLAFHQTIAVILIMHLRESGVTLLTLTNAGTNSVSPNVTCSNIALQRDYQGTQATLRVQITCQSWSEQSPHKHTSTQSKYLKWVASDPDLCFLKCGQVLAFHQTIVAILTIRLRGPGGTPLTLTNARTIVASLNL